MYFPFFELIDGMTECLLFFVEKCLVPGRIIIPIEYHSCTVQLEWFEWWLFFK